MIGNEFNKKLNKVAEANLFKRYLDMNLGLFNGKMGMAIFFFKYARHIHSTVYKQFAEDLITYIYEDVNVNTPINMKDGLCGIGWGIEYLIQNNYIEGETDKILKEIDCIIMERDPIRIQDLSLETGLEGIIWYALIHLFPSQNNSLFDKTYKESLEKACKAHVSYPSKLLLQMLKGKSIKNYPYKEVLLPILFSKDEDELSWKEGLKILL